MSGASPLTEDRNPLPGAGLFRRALFLLLLFAAHGIEPGPARAGVYDLLGLGPRSVALGGAYTALADDFTSLYYNPAGLSGEAESSMTLGGLWAKPYFTYREAGLPSDQVPKLYATASAYLGVSTNLGHLTGYHQLSPWTFGISLYLPVERALMADIPYKSSEKSFIFYRDQSQVLSVLLGLSWKILDWLSVGVSGNFLADLRAGRFDDLLVYKKAVRKALDEYTETTPPHVRAARKLGSRAGRIISYVMTTSGPEPAGETTAPPDYDHYIEHQIRPVADAVLRFLGIDFQDAAGTRRQLRLF